MILKPEFKAAWLAALRSGDYQQTTGYLHRADSGFCCLGVACDVANKMGLVQGKWIYTDLGNIANPPLSFKPDNKLGLEKNLPYDVRLAIFEVVDFTRIDEILKHLVDLNDGGKTFDHIADVIEQEY